MGNFGLFELFIIFIAIILIFGGKKLPELAKNLGKGFKEFNNIINNSNQEENQS